MIPILNRYRLNLTILVLLAGVFSNEFRAAPISSQSIVPLTRAHAHNDYEHQRPLLDALSHGFTSVEADVHLIGNELLVAHNQRDAHTGKTLQSLYLEPLRRMIAENQGSVYPDGASFTLFIDIKTEGEETYQAIQRVLETYSDILSSFSGGKVTEGPVTIIISGNRPRDTMERQNFRYAAYDGRLTDLGSKSPSSFIPIISDNWNKHFNWKGDGTMPPVERKKLIEIVRKAHDNNQRVRFWATVDKASIERAAVWTELLHAGADLFNTDDLTGLRDFLIEKDTEK